MRPRVFPAEDIRMDVDTRMEVIQASMRPRVFPAEDVERRRTQAQRRCASMRPRVFPAEDITVLVGMLGRQSLQ